MSELELDKRLDEILTEFYYMNNDQDETVKLIKKEFEDWFEKKWIKDFNEVVGYVNHRLDIRRKEKINE